MSDCLSKVENVQIPPNYDRKQTGNLNVINCDLFVPYSYEKSAALHLVHLRLGYRVKLKYSDY